MIAALIEYFTDYEYDYKFYAMHQIGAKYPLYEEIFIYIVFFLDMLIFSGVSTLSQEFVFRRVFKSTSNPSPADSLLDPGPWTLGPGAWVGAWVESSGLGWGLWIRLHGTLGLGL